MRLHALLRQFDPSLAIHLIPDVEISGIEEDSRKPCAGVLFVARSGLKTDGRVFIDQAVSRGAAAVVMGPTPQSPVNSCLSPGPTCPVPRIAVADPTRAMSRLANLFHGDPSTGVRVIGVTGTNGKTTTTYLLRHMLGAVGKKCGLIGTVQTDDGRSIEESQLTTPSSVDIAKLLGTMRDNGCAACAMEVSSQGLDQGRVAGVRFAGAGFTNLTQDHLDYHGTMERYCAAKALLFAGLAGTAVAAVNADDEWTPKILRDCQARVATWGFRKAADYRAEDVLLTASASQFTLATPDGKAPVKMHLLGRHNVANALTAAALACEAMGLSVHAVAAALSNAPSAPGRLQAVRCGQPFAVLVDYAHTDDALHNVLSALRKICKGKLRVLFGCGGDRDPKKRPKMAQAAEQWADAIYVTSDNPRTENPQTIIDQITAGFSADLISSKRADKSLVVEPDRRQAIEKVVADAQSGDVVLLAGKGHENYQIVGTEKRHFDDMEEAQRAIKARLVVA